MTKKGLHHGDTEGTEKKNNHMLVFSVFSVPPWFFLSKGRRSGGR